LLYIVDIYRLCAILEIERQHNLVIVEINRVYEGVYQPLALVAV
jgi:hypothetical protein